nr:hypothetical protein [uncultured Campylobacter sp.]
MRLHSSCTPQGTFIENTAARTFNELAEFKKITLEALVRLLGGKKARKALMVKSMNS